MIVRNEAAVLERCIASARGLISSWVICDTGSTDGTPELVQRLLGDLPGRLLHRPWRNFGHNRSELMEAARDSASYLLLLDADMTLEVGGPLPALVADSYLVRHRGDLAYWTPRLVRGDLPWRFDGVTHEYLAIDGPFTEERLEQLLIVHHGDGGSRDDKFTRDAAYLEARLAEAPNDVRAVFYLAQTMRDLGERDRAIALYEQRVAMGGWNEEVFYAGYQAGLLLAGVDPPRAVERLLDTWQRRPVRAEPLHALAVLCRDLGRHEEALAFAEHGLTIPVPADLLFVHADIYAWGMLFEWSISAANVGRLEEAIDANDRLLAMPLPANVARRVRGNRHWCLEQLGLSAAGRPVAPVLIGATEVPRLEAMIPGVRIAELTVEVQPPWPVFNPSVALDAGGDVRLIARTANYLIADHGNYWSLDEDGAVRTLNYLVEFDEALGVRRIAPISEAEPHPIFGSVTGYEDCRLFRRGDRWFATATSRDRNPEMRCEMVLLELDGGRIVRSTVLPSPEDRWHEKNWMPVGGGETLRLVYSCTPTVVLECDVDSGDLTEVIRHPGPDDGGGYRGGSQLAALPGGGYLCVVHEVSPWNGWRAYTQRFIRFDEDLRIVARSAPFCFQGLQAEFCAGLAIRGETALLSFGIGDRAAFLAIAVLDDILCNFTEIPRPLEGDHGGRSDDQRR